MATNEAELEEGYTSSIASTIEEENESDQEWDFTGILAEAEIQGEVKYLIAWTGYELFDASWEPKDYLSGEETLEKWNESKKLKGHDREQQLNIGAWRKAVIERCIGKISRHAERDRKRAERGLHHLRTALDSTLETCLEFLDEYPKGIAPDDNEDALVRTDTALQALDLQKKPKDNVDRPYDGVAADRQTSDQGGADQASRRDSTSTKHSDDQGKNTSIPRNNSEVGSGRSSKLNQPVPRRQTEVGDDEPGPLQQQASNHTLMAKLGRHKPSKQAVPSRKDTPILQSNSSSGEISNVFVGGTTRKRRNTLLEAVSDPTKKPQMLKLRHQRLIEKRRRDREGIVAPTARPTGLFFLNSEQAKLVEQSQCSPSVLSPDSIGADDEPSSPKASEAKQKKKKSVRWNTDILDQASTVPTHGDLMDLGGEGSLFIEGALTPAVTPAVTEDVGKIPKGEDNTLYESLDALIQKASALQRMDTRSNKMQNLIKPARFGPASSMSIPITLNGLSEAHAHFWTTFLNSEETLVFTHSCLMRDLRDATTRTVLVSEELFHGSVESSEQAKLRNVSDRLRLGSIGLLCYLPGLSLLICHQDSIRDPGTAQSADSSMDAPLQYMLFHPNVTFPDTLLGPVSVPEEVAGKGLMPSMMQTIFYRMLGLEYNQLIPQSLSSTTKHNFFLAFPASVQNEAMLLCAWLRHCNPKCNVQCSLWPGHWNSFRRVDRGVVIIHEEAVWAIRQFPGFAEMLHSSGEHYSILLFNRALQKASMFPSTSLTYSEVGEIGLQQVFPCRKATLISPSFIVAHPQQAYNFLKFFWQTYEADSNAARLVVCANFDSWVADLVAEKVARRELTPRTVLEATLVKTALHDDAFEAMFKTITLVRKLIDLPMEMGTSEPFVYAPDSIDGNDEQSLVNWFGWWSIMNMDQFRRFSVIGSSKTPETKIKRFNRRLKTPEYLPSTFSNPDDAYIWPDRLESEAQPTAGRPQAPSGQHTSQRFQLVPDDDARSLMHFLMDLDRPRRNLFQKGGDPRNSGIWCPIVVYGDPVSYWNPDMAFHFRDYLSSFRSYKTCLDFLSKQYNHFYSTGMAFCHTIEGPWDSRLYAADTKPIKRPWIMILRPINPHRRPWKASEVLIWDPMWKNLPEKGEHAYTSDLLPAQREMISEAERQEYSTSMRLPLQNVWIRGPETAESGHIEPLDATLCQMKRFLEDPKKWLPAPQEVLSGRGWQPVDSGGKPAGGSVDQRWLEPTEPKKRDQEQIGHTLSLRTVFHPPRGNGVKGHTRCKNRLYEWTLALNRKRGGGKGEIMGEYVFRPTMEWYGEQMEEGRGYAHINVTPWEAIFERYSIPDPKMI